MNRRVIGAIAGLSLLLPVAYLPVAISPALAQQQSANAAQAEIRAEILAIVPNGTVERITIDGAYGLVDVANGEAFLQFALLRDEGYWQVYDLPGGVIGITDLNNAADIPMREARQLLARHTDLASANQPSVAPELSDVMAQLAQMSGVFVLLPTQIPADFDEEIFVGGTAGAEGYKIDLGFAPNCTATSCFLGSFAAWRSGDPYYYIAAAARPVQLANGIIGYYKPLTCGASCAPPVLWWSFEGVNYAIEYKVPGSETEQLSAMIQMASSSIVGGAR